SGATRRGGGASTGHGDADWFEETRSSGGGLWRSTSRQRVRGSGLLGGPGLENPSRGVYWERARGTDSLGGHLFIGQVGLPRGTIRTEAPARLQPVILFRMRQHVGLDCLHVLLRIGHDVLLVMTGFDERKGRMKNEPVTTVRLSNAHGQDNRTTGRQRQYRGASGARSRETKKVHKTRFR